MQRLIFSVISSETALIQHGGTQQHWLQGECSTSLSLLSRTVFSDRTRKKKKKRDKKLVHRPNKSPASCSVADLMQSMRFKEERIN